MIHAFHIRLRLSLMFQCTGQKADENDEVDSGSYDIVIKEDIQQGISFVINHTTQLHNCHKHSKLLIGNNYSKEKTQHCMSLATLPHRITKHGIYTL